MVGSVNDTDVVRLSANRLDSRDPITSMRLPVVLRERISEAAPERSMAEVTREALELWLSVNARDPLPLGQGDT